MDTIANIHLRSTYGDSLIFYGARIHREIPKLEPKNPESKYFLLRGYYYEGIGKKELGLLDDAIGVFINGISAPDAQKFPEWGYLKLGLAETYLLKGQFKKVEDILAELETASTSAALYNEIQFLKADYLLSQQLFTRARSSFKALKNNTEIPERSKLGIRVAIRLGQLAKNEEKLGKALDILVLAKDISLEEGFYDLYVNAAAYEGGVYEQLNEYAAGEVALSSAYVNAIQWNRQELQLKIIQALVQLYLGKGDYKNAYSLMSQSAVITKNIADQQNKILARDLEFKYETLKKEQEIKNLEEEQLLKQAEIERQKTIKIAILIGFLIILVPIILLLYVYYQKLQVQSALNTQQEILNEQEVRSLLKAQELKLVKTSISVQHEERRRIAQELHDSIGGNLAAIKLKMHGLKENNTLKEKLARQLDATYQQVREISHSLIPKEFEEEAFVQLIREYLANLNGELATEIRFNAYPEKAINGLDERLHLALFNSIKELMTNAFKHAKASKIEIQIGIVPENGGRKSIEFLYEDDGVGFDPNVLSKGIGLKNMDSRVKELNGIFSINSTQDRGTVISLSIPKP